MTKMVADWFVGKEIATAMPIFSNAWPAGVAMSLLVLLLISSAYGVSAAVTASIGLGFVPLAAMYEPPANSVTTVAAYVRLNGNVAVAVIAAGLIWGLYNVSFATIFGFWPSCWSSMVGQFQRQDRRFASYYG